MQTWPDNNEFMEFFKRILCYLKSIFVFRSSVNSIGTEGTVHSVIYVSTMFDTYYVML